jgi:glutamyl/glutaminyl-tRNA synthetase
VHRRRHGHLDDPGAHGLSAQLARAERCRFAPTPSGAAHPGTLLAGLLAWLDARSRGAQFLLRLEDVDPLRCTNEHADELRAALAWLGLDWDAEQIQSRARARHEAALDALASAGRLHPCTCSRSEIRSAGVPAADGGFRYAGRCAERELPHGGWREALAAGSAIRLRLAPGLVELRDESGLDLSQDPDAAMGNPILLRRDGAVAYHLAVVVDDAQDGISRVVRGRDLASSTAIHLTLQRALGLPTPAYRHHLLLLEPQGGKLAKLHGAVGFRALAERYSGAELCGLLAELVGLRERRDPATPRELLAEFSWSRVASRDIALRWTGSALERVD